MHSEVIVPVVISVLCTECCILPVVMNPFSFSSVDELRSQCLLQTLSMYVFGLAARQLIPSLKTDQSSIGHVLIKRSLLGIVHISARGCLGPASVQWDEQAHRLDEKHPRKTLQIKFKFERISEL